MMLFSPRGRREYRERNVYFMTRAELKAQAKAQLGGGIFKNEWLTALAACLIMTVITSAAGTILTGIGSILVSGRWPTALPISF